MKRETFFARLNDRKGTVSVVVALLLVMLIGFAALALDVGYMMVKRNELQNIADAAALAATGELGFLYSSMTFTAQQEYECGDGDRSDIVSVARALATSMSLTIRDDDVITGHWDSTTNVFTPGLSRPNAVRVNTRRDSAANGPVPTFLAGVLGISSVSVSAGATAALSSLNHVPEGGLPLPVGISMAWFSDPAVYCSQPIRLYPTNDPAGCAGWNVYEESPASAEQLKSILDGLTDGGYQSPETIAGQTAYRFTGGTLGQQAFSKMKLLFDTKKVKNDGVIDKDDDPNTWTTAVPVYDWPDCSNPNPRDGPITIVGFSTIAITNVSTPPDMTIDAQVVCDIIAGGSGGGLDLGTIGSIPNLVE
jgi:hypothetical protein